MAILEFWGCGLITFGPALALFCMSVAHDPVKIILLICSSFFSLISLMFVSICWSLLGPVCGQLVIGGLLAVVSQETFRYLFHKSTRMARTYLAKILEDRATVPEPPVIAPDRNGDSQRTASAQKTIDEHLSKSMSSSYVSGFGFGLMSAAMSVLNVLADFVGPGTSGLSGESAYFLVVMSLEALGFLLLNIAWSIMMSESIDKSDKRLAAITFLSHLIATGVVVSLMIIYTLVLSCGTYAFKIVGLSPSKMIVCKH